MAKKKRHTDAEIAAKLQQAAALAAEGKTQNEIAQALGISIMTFHRWRNAQPQRPQPSALPPPAPARTLPQSDRENRIAELQNENARLRKIVTDLLLEKMRLEEEMQERRGNGPKKNAVC